MKASVCIETIYTEYPFLDRIGIAAEQGFDAIEFWSWRNKDLDALRSAAAANRIGIAAFGSNHRGTLVAPEQRELFLEGIRESLATAAAMGVEQLLFLTDELAEDGSARYRSPERPTDAQLESMREGLRAVAPLAEAAGVTLLLEPLNTRVDHAGYPLSSTALAVELLREAGSPRLRLLYDIYHMQIMEGNLIPTIERYAEWIGHVHVADTPGRHEPGTGEINYGVVLERLRRAGYQGYVGMEFFPSIASREAAAGALRLVRGTAGEAALGIGRVNQL